MIFHLTQESFFPGMIESLSAPPYTIKINHDKFVSGMRFKVVCFFDSFAFDGKLYGITSNRNAYCDAETRVKGEREEYHLSL